MTTITTNTKRLYIGNLDNAVDEYAIVKLFEPYGKITFIDVMVHWAGPKKGLPRGYCFLEYEKKEQALKAIHSLHGKTIKGKPLVVSFAHLTVDDDVSKRRGHHSGRPNPLSLLRGQKMMNSSTEAKIKAIEKKLQSLQDKSTSSSNSSNSSTSSTIKHKPRYKPY
ncbi:hypothetical protein BDB01DRAFT_799995 [Pilobolus umbonatus]|nr:hypothetical protein BDB01DRAFT_799995 [Pilobolus umbonatus]